MEITLLHKRGSPVRAAVALLALWLSGCGKPPEPAAKQNAERAMPVEMQTVATETVTETINAVGSLMADEAVVIRSEIPGVIRSINFAEGQLVEQGAKLVTLDAREQEAIVAQTEATVHLARLSFERAKDLQGGGMISKQEFDQAFSRLKESEAALRRNRVLLDKTVLVAPFSGTIGLRRVSPGAYIQPGQDLVNLENIDPVKAEFQISERYVAALRADRQIEVRVDAFSGETFKGQIYATDPRLDPRTRAFSVRASIPNPQHRLQPGMFARVKMVARQRPDAVVIPEQAIWPQGEKLFVYLVVEGKAALTPVVTGERFDGKVEIREGLEPGSTIVTEGQLKIRNGMTVVDVRAIPGAAPGKPS